MYRLIFAVQQEDLENCRIQLLSVASTSLDWSHVLYAK